jgi:hypothetical protein
MATVTVTAPAGRAVYIDGNYTPIIPQIIPYTFLVEDGPNVFETLDDAGNVDYTATVTSGPANPDCSVALVHV